MTIYRVDYNLTTAMTTPFTMSLGFSKTDIGLVTKGLELSALIAGAPSGYLAQALDWRGYFTLCCLVGVPALA